MSHRERLLTKIAHREPDRVPLDLGAGIAAFHIGLASMASRALYHARRKGMVRVYQRLRRRVRPPH